MKLFSLFKKDVFKPFHNSFPFHNMGQNSKMLQYFNFSFSLCIFAIPLCKRKKKKAVCGQPITYKILAARKQQLSFYLASKINKEHNYANQKARLQTTCKAVRALSHIPREISALLSQHMAPGKSVITGMVMESFSEVVTLILFNIQIFTKVCCYKLLTFSLC